MLAEIQSALQRLLYERGRINPREIDIQFEAPTREQIDKLTRPTISIFLFDLQENTDLRQSAFQTNRTNGRAERRLFPRRFDLRYMVSALTTDIADEHRLLWRTLLTLVRHPQFPPEILEPEELRLADPPLTTRVSQTDEGQRLAGLWTALGAPLHPALYYVITAPVDLNVVIEAPLVLTRTARYHLIPHPSLVEKGVRGVGPAPEIGIQIGGLVRDETGNPLPGVQVTLEGRAGTGSITDTLGHFTLRNVPSGTVQLRIAPADGTAKIVTVAVPPPYPGLPLESTPPHSPEGRAQREGARGLDPALVYEIVLESARAQAADSRTARGEDTS